MFVEGRMRRLLLLTALTWACNSGEASDPVVGTRAEVGDTALLVSSGSPQVIEPTMIHTVWQSGELEEPRTLAYYSEGLLLVGDPTRIHLLPLSGGQAQTLGGKGEGPGEFRSVISVGFGEDGTLLVLDGALHRLSSFNQSGDLLRSDRISVEPPFLNPTMTGQSLILWHGGLLTTRSGFALPDRIARVALIWYDLEADTAEVLETWEDIQRERQGDFVLSPKVFPPRPIIGLGKGGRVAAGDGLDYCFLLSSIQGQSVTRVCRTWSRAEVTQGIRSPDPDVIEDPSQRDLARRVIDFQDPGEYLPSFDLLRFGEGGEVWVRTIGPELAQVHPMILSRRPDLGPSQRNWDVFDGEGHLRVTVRFPREFDPRVMLSDRVFGFLELETGEIVVGEAVFGNGIYEVGNGR